MQVTDGDGQRVGDVVRRRRLVEPEQQLDHLLHLVLLGPAVADHRTLDLGGRVFDDRHARLGRREQRHAARVAELQRAADVARIEDVLDRDAVRPVLAQERDQAGVYRLQLVGKGGVRCGRIASRR